MILRYACLGPIALGISLSDAACNLPPPAPPLSPEGAKVRIILADEHGDEWLHDRCLYTGTIDATSSSDARNRAGAASSNVVEPITEPLPEGAPSHGGLAVYGGEAVGESKMFSCDRLPEGL